VLPASCRQIVQARIVHYAGKMPAARSTDTRAALGEIREHFATAEHPTSNIQHPTPNKVRSNSHRKLDVELTGAMK
jgi:hypothetical protein